MTATELPVEASSAPTVEAAGWINTDPLSSADLDGKVVLYDFWTFGALNRPRELCSSVLDVLLLTGTYARIVGPLARVFPGTS